MVQPKREKELTSGFTLTAEMSGGGFPNNTYPFLNDFTM
jgi:hypothetical protein